jgi:hypothetical protein
MPCQRNESSLLTAKRRGEARSIIGILERLIVIHSRVNHNLSPAFVAEEVWGAMKCSLIP